MLSSLAPPSTPMAGRLPDRCLKRRSKSLDDLYLKRSSIYTPTPDLPTEDSDHDTVYCPTDVCTNEHETWVSGPAPPLPTPSVRPAMPRRRHSSCCIEPNSKEGLQLASIYGWVSAAPGTTKPRGARYNRTSVAPSPKTKQTTKHHHSTGSTGSSILAQRARQHSQRQKRRTLRTSRSFNAIDNVPHKLTKMFARRRKSLCSPRPPEQTSADSSLATLSPSTFYGSNPATWHAGSEKTTGIVSAIIAAAKTSQHPQPSLGWIGVEEDTPDEDDNAQGGGGAGGEEAAESHEQRPPPPPIEYDPHVFDLLSEDSPRLINYSKREASQGLMNSATVEKLVEKLTREMDSDFMMDFFLTYRQYLSRIKLCKLLILRFRWALLQDTDEHRLVRIRTFVAIRHWLTHYWAHDFMSSRMLRFMLCTFLSQLRTHPLILASPRDARIIKSLRTVLKRQRQIHGVSKTESSGSPRSSVSNIDSLMTPSLPVARGTPCTDPHSTYSNGADSDACSQSLPRYSSPKTRESRKDSAIAMTTTLPKDVKPSTSTPLLPFLHRSHRFSAASQRSVNEGGNAWTARMNFGIKSIKRSMPTMCHTLWQGIHPHPPQQQEIAKAAVQRGPCTCEKTPVQRRFRKTSERGLMHSASRILIFDKKASMDPLPRPSLSTPVPTRRSSPKFKAGARRDTKHPHPLCPFHAVPRTPVLMPSLSNRVVSPRSTLSRTSVVHEDAKPLVLQYRSEVIAQQFCILEQRMLQNVTWDELAELRWKKGRRSSAADDLDSCDPQVLSRRGGVGQLIGYFNMTCQWVASEIVQLRSLEVRTQVIEKYIRIALKCYHHRNYSTLMQILLGLQSPAVSRLEKTWQRVGHYEMQIFNELKELAKPFRNWKNVREAMSSAIENIAETSAVESALTQSQMDSTELLSSRGCIPFLGLYLSDLVFNAELPTFIAPPAQDEQGETRTDSDAELNSRLSTHLVNYNKYRITASIIKHVLAFQVLSRSYSFPTHPDLLQRLQSLQYLDNAEIRSASQQCEH